jgi:2-amino-4-hydroxy-6-hydroxymethyldihydropteridine diphosphokinase
MRTGAFLAIGCVMPAQPPVTAYLALGSNLGDRIAWMRQAVQLLGADPAVSILQVSSLYETTPVGGPPGQGPYLNAVLAVSTTLPAEELLRLGHRIEDRLGRTRSVPDGPRTIDVDLLLYGDKMSNTPDLLLPHPRMHERRFVLVPLCEIAPGARHSKTGVTTWDLLGTIVTDAPQSVRRIAGPDWVLPGVAAL